MSFFNEILLLFFKEIRLEIRSLFSFSGVLIYIFSIIFICYISISINNGYLNPIIWNSLFWIILLFISLYSISRKFSYENESRLLYYYSLVRPESMIFSKIFYNFFFLFFIFLLIYFLFTFFLGNPVIDYFIFILNLFFASISFSSLLTLTSSISSKSDNYNILMPTISMPIIIPILLLLIKISKNSLCNYDIVINLSYILILFFINLILIFLSYILFPYLWKN